MPITSVCTTEYCNIYQVNQNIACHNLSALHVNIRSLIKNMSKLEDMLTDLSLSLDLIAISDTWLTDSKTVNVNLPGYNFFFANSPKGKQNSKHTARGVGMFVKKSLCATQTELSILCKDCEDLWLDLELANHTKLIFGVIYRHPQNNISEYQSNLCALLMIVIPTRNLIT